MSFSIPPLRNDLRTLLSSVLCALAVFVLSSCGGGGSTVAGLPGTGGTGSPINVTAMGPVSGFGSVIVNGIRYDDSGAVVRVDDVVGDGSSMRLGMTTKVIGTQLATSPTSTTLGVANSIEIWSVAQGAVENIQLPSTVTVAGLTLAVDVGTVFVDAASLASLKTGSVIKVWGLPRSADFSQWTITRLEVLTTTKNTVSTGKVVIRVGQPPKLNGLTLVNAPVDLVDGQLIRVLGVVSDPNRSVLTATQTTVLAEAGSTVLSTGYAETQGMVSSILNTLPGSPSQVTRLTLGAGVVDISNATVLPAGTVITQGMRLQVQGQWNAGVLMASQVKAISDQDLKAVDVEGVIEAIRGTQTIFVRGQQFDLSGLAPTQQALLNMLQVGTRVRVVGVKNDNLVVVNSIEIR